MVLSNGLLAMGPTIFELWFMETELWVMEIDDPNTPLVIEILVFYQEDLRDLLFSNDRATAQVIHHRWFEGPFIHQW